jgi:DNA-binding LacI/PurR family transcriptional regulator
MQALGVINKARGWDCAIPEDLAILGFDDLDFADYFGLSTIRQPLDESGRLAVEILLSRINDPERPFTPYPFTAFNRRTANHIS